MGHHRNILELPSEILDHIWNYCSKASLLKFACCSRTCNDLVTYKKYEEMHIRWPQLEQEEMPLSVEGIKFTKSLSFYPEGSGNMCRSESEWERVCINFYHLMNNVHPSKLESISISSGRSLDGYLLPIFIKFENLKVIKLTHTHALHGSMKLTLKCLSKLRYLEKLDLKNIMVSVEDFGNIHHLTELNVSCCTLNGLINWFFFYISKLKKLRLLGFSCNRDSSLEAIEIPMENMQGLTSLERLDLSKSIIFNQQELNTIFYEMKSLRWLSLRHIQLTNSIEHICQLQLLANLDLYGCLLDDQDIASLFGLPQLYYLNVGYNQITNNGLVYIGQMVSLQELDIGHDNDLTDEGIRYLTTLTQLNKIDIGECNQLTGVSLIHLSALPALKMIGVEGSIIDDDIIEKMKVLKKDWEFEEYNHLFQDDIFSY